MKNELLADRTLGNMNDWQSRHNSAVMVPRAGFERALTTMLQGWSEYARAYRERYEDGEPIGGDYVLGPEWAAIGQGLRGLLNGDSGTRLDMGTLDAFINRTLADNGVTETE